MIYNVFIVSICFLVQMNLYSLCFIHFHIEMADIGLGIIEVFPLQTDFGLTSGVLQVCKIVISPIHNLSWNRLSQVNQHYGRKKKKQKLEKHVTDISSLVGHWQVFEFHTPVLTSIRNG